ncbi:MAG: F0F1 ATP synthase subunit delta [Proteobacteria bacterium]|nr:F0F1 ATP synthase subunit delta [Pseudomonadota bacterium]
MSSKITGAAGLVGRYAGSLYDLAEADKILDQVSEDLRDLAAMIHGSDDLTRLIRSPAIGRADQSRAMAAVLEEAGMSDLTRRFVGVVAANRRLFQLTGMIGAYHALLAERRGEATAEVVSARELTKTQLKAIGDAVRKVVGTRVSVDARVDSGLLGGLIVKVGSRMVDSSLSTKLQRLRLAMKGIG